MPRKNLIEFAGGPAPSRKHLEGLCWMSLSDHVLIFHSDHPAALIPGPTMAFYLALANAAARDRRRLWINKFFFFINIMQPHWWYSFIRFKSKFTAKTHRAYFHFGRNCAEREVLGSGGIKTRIRGKECTVAGTGTARHIHCPNAHHRLYSEDFSHSSQMEKGKKPTA